MHHTQYSALWRLSRSGNSFFSGLMLESESLLVVVLVGEETSPSIWNCSVLPWEWEERRVAIMFRLSLSWRCKRIQGRTGGWADPPCLCSWPVQSLCFHTCSSSVIRLLSAWRPAVAVTGLTGSYRLCLLIPVPRFGQSVHPQGNRRPQSRVQAPNPPVETKCLWASDLHV